MKRLSLLLLLMMGGLVLTGCNTSKIDWAPRVGTYTFDDAVREFGPPDKKAELTDGTVVADWITSRGGARVYSTPWVAGDRYGRYYGWNDTYTVNAPDWIIRLEFGPDGKLLKHQRVVQ